MISSLEPWRSERTLKRGGDGVSLAHPALNAVQHGRRFDMEYLTPLSKTLSLPAHGNPAITAGVARLLFGCRPPYIPGLIVSVCILPVQRMLARRASPYMLQKVLVRPKSELDAAPSVSGVSLCVRVITASLSSAIRSIFCGRPARPRLAVGKAAATYSVSTEAAAGSRVAATQIARGDYAPVAAVAQAEPHTHPMLTLAVDADHCQPPKSLGSQIIKLVMGTVKRLKRFVNIQMDHTVSVCPLTWEMSRGSYMKYFAFLILFVAYLAVPVSGQSPCPDPEGCVTITRKAALKALADADRVTELEKRLNVLTDALSAKSDLLDQMRIQYAEARGELTALRQQSVRDGAERLILIQNTRKRCLPFAICVN